MIHIQKDADVIENPNLKVATATGDYDDHAHIEVYDISAPEIVVGAFQAQYIKYGSIVYSFNSHMELGAAILKLDPQSTHTSASYVRMSRELLAQMNGGSLESTSLDEVISVEKKNIEEQIEKTPEVPVEVPEEAPVEEPVVPAPEEVVPEVPIIETPSEVVPPEIIPEEVPVVQGEVLGESVTSEVVPPVVEEVVPEVQPPTIIEEIIEEVIPVVEDMLPEPVAKLIRRTKTLSKAKKAKKAKKIA